MTSKTQPPELIFVVLNFMALDDCTRHAPFAIEQKPSHDLHQSDRKRDFQFGQFNPTFNSQRHCQQDGEMPDILIEPCA